MNSNSIKKNLRLGLGISLSLLILSSIASFISIQNLIKNSKMVSHSNEVIATLSDVLAALKDAETGQRGFLLTGSDEFLEPHVGAGKRAIDLVEYTKTLTSDNPTLILLADELKAIIEKRRAFLRNGIELKRNNQPVSISLLQEGRALMDEARDLIERMKEIELSLLETRTQAMNKFAGYTPYLIVFAAILSLLITIIFYRRVALDANKRIALQQSLAQKNEEIANRIVTIQKIAAQISSGDYNIRMEESESDHLGALAGSLNSMAQSLQYSFNLIADKEWMQTGIANLNSAMVGEKTLSSLVKDTLAEIAQHIDSQVGALYILHEDNSLYLEGHYAANKKLLPNKLEIGEGFIGHCFKANKPLLLENIPDNELNITYATGRVKPTNIVVIPILRNGYTIGAMEFGSTYTFNEKQIEFLNETSELVGLGIHVAQNREKLQELLEETQTQTEELQAQTEELQTQHTELESMNAELEAQTQKIQASEEELRVQQEELLQANRELEERSSLLEERNVIITDRNQEIQQKAEQLELSTKYKSEFLANMSHELRTPLNSILLLSRLMVDNEELDKEFVEYASVIQSSGQGLLTLIDEILDLSKIEAGKMSIDIEPVNIKDVAKGLEGLFRPLTNEKNLELVVNIPEGLDSEFYTDRLRLEQILKNLLSNAIKFTSVGKVSLEIEKNKKFICFKVTDTGIGIALDKQSLIFEAFQQEDGSTRRRFGGTGLGLSISRELAKLLGGVIELKSTEQKGSTFSLILPLNANETLELEKEVVSVDVQAEALPASSLVVQNIPNEIEDDRDNIKAGDSVILIIEDDTPFARVLLDYTRKRKYKGIVAVRGDVGIEMAKSYRPKAILLDIQLPVMDGWQVMEELKANPETRPIPVHIMSSLEVKKESLLKGAVDFINKPFALEHMPKIFEKLEDALSRFPKKVLIVEENKQHAKALSYYLSNHNINTSIASNIEQSIHALSKNEVDCVILDMGIPDQNAYNTLDTIKKIEGLEKLPIIVFTGKNLSKGEESKLKLYADSIVVKTAHSYQRILDEAGLFLHLVEEQQIDNNDKKPGKFQQMQEVLQGKTILVADDDVRNIFSLTKALEQHKVNVIAVTDGQQALNKLKENKQIDLVLMDMMMPELDGYESTKAIRAIPEFRTLPIIAVTAKTMVGDREKCIAAGASDYISKPVDVDQLISLLRVWLYDRI